MPDVFVKGKGHQPVMTVAGHYLGMHVPDRPDPCKPDQLWYRGDDYQSLVALIESQGLRIAELEIQVARRPPKRAERP